MKTGCVTDVQMDRQELMGIANALEIQLMMKGGICVINVHLIGKVLDSVRLIKYLTLFEITLIYGNDIPVRAYIQHVNVRIHSNMTILLTCVKLYVVVTALECIHIADAKSPECIMMHML